MKPSVYIESSVISYLTSRPSRDLITAANQELTREWWERRLPLFRAAVSETVLNEIRQGDNAAAAKRLEAIEGIPVLPLREDAMRLAQVILQSGALPAKAAADALHVALGSVYGMDYLLTWNCTHIANAGIQRDLMRIIASNGFEMPVICTPQELMGDDGHVERPDS